ncbi:MAG: ABC transporter substrate-binding protein [Candidatus Binatia bacterium]
MQRKIVFWLVAIIILATHSRADAQQSTKVYRVGYLWPTRQEQGQSRLDVFKLGMRDYGYEVGKNLSIESRFADGKSDRLPGLAADLVRLNVDVIVTGVNPGVVAAKQATSTIPIVMTSGNDPIGSGLVASLARPGGNVTGLSMDTGEENFGKRLELTKESLSKLSRVAVLFNSGNAAHQLYLKNLEQPARHLKVTLLHVGYREIGDFGNAFKTMTAKRADAMFLFSDGVSADQRPLIASLAIKHRLPSSYPERSYVEAGGLLSYGPDFNNNMRRAAIYVDKILKGANPAELPVEQPTKFDFVVNLITAKQIGVTIPPNVLVRADRVIR